MPFFVTVRRSCATWAAPSNPIQAGASAVLIVRRARRPWSVLTAETAGIAAAYQPGTSNGRIPRHIQPPGRSRRNPVPNEPSGAMLMITTARLASVHIGGSRAMAATGDCHVARLVLQSTSDLIADSVLDGCSEQTLRLACRSSFLFAVPAPMTGCYAREL